MIAEFLIYFIFLFIVNSLLLLNGIATYKRLKAPKRIRSYGYRDPKKYSNGKRDFRIKKVNDRLIKLGSPNLLDPETCLYTVKQLKAMHRDGKILTQTILKLNKQDKQNLRPVNG